MNWNLAIIYGRLNNMNIKQKPFGLGLFLLFLIIISYTWATWRYFTSVVPGGNDFLTHYGAWEAYLKHGMNPYSDEATLHTQQAIYGRPANQEEDQNRMVYPFYSIILHGPFVYINYPLARAIYMTLLQAVLFIGVIMTLSLVRWRPQIWMLALLMIWSLLYYPQARGVILGQFAIFGFFSLVCSLYLLRRNHDIPAGIILVLSTIKPTMVFLIIPYLLLWASFRRRWGFFLGFFGMLAIVTIASMLASPTWILDWIDRILHYSEYTVGQSPVWLFTHVAYPQLGFFGEVIISLVVLVGMFFLWWSVFRSQGDNVFYWVLSVTIVISNLIVPRSATTNYVLMLLPIIWIFAALDRSFNWGKWIILSVLIISIVGLWWLHFTTVVGNQEQAIMFLPSPIILGVLLILGRKWLLNDALRATINP